MSGTSKKIKIPMLLGIIVLCLSIGGLSGFAVYKGNTAQRPPDVFVLNLLGYFPSSCAEIP